MAEAVISLVTLVTGARHVKELVEFIGVLDAAASAKEWVVSFGGRAFMFIFDIEPFENDSPEPPASAWPMLARLLMTVVVAALEIGRAHV